MRFYDQTTKTVLQCKWRMVFGVWILLFFLDRKLTITEGKKIFFGFSNIFFFVYLFVNALIECAQNSAFLFHFEWMALAGALFVSLEWPQILIIFLMQLALSFARYIWCGLSFIISMECLLWCFLVINENTKKW